MRHLNYLETRENDFYMYMFMQMVFGVYIFAWNVSMWVFHACVVSTVKRNDLYCLFYTYRAISEPWETELQCLFYLEN